MPLTYWGRIWKPIKEKAYHLAVFDLVLLLFLPNTGMGMKRPAEEDYNSNVHAKRSKDEEDGSGQSATLRFLLESKVRLILYQQLQQWQINHST